MEQMKFDHYYCYAELENFLKSLAQEHPGLTRLESAGKSGEGREIWVMTLSDMSTGDPEDKPAIYIDGNFHAGEVTGSMINLYTIRHTLENYGNDERITKLLQRYTLYVIPRVSPDGAEMYLTTPETLRSVPRPYPFPNPDEQEGDVYKRQIKHLPEYVREDWMEQWFTLYSETEMIKSGGIPLKLHEKVGKLKWWEFGAATGSTLGIFSLIAYSSLGIFETSEDKGTPARTGDFHAGQEAGPALSLAIAYFLSLIHI